MMKHESNPRNDNCRYKKAVSAAWSDSAVRYMLSAEDFGTTGGLSSPSRWSAVAGSFGLRRAKDSFTAVRCHTRSLSQNNAIPASRRGGIFYCTPLYLQAQRKPLSLTSFKLQEPYAQK